MHAAHDDMRRSARVIVRAWHGVIFCSFCRKVICSAVRNKTVRSVYMIGTMCHNAFHTLYIGKESPNELKSTARHK